MCADFLRPSLVQTVNLASTCRVVEIQIPWPAVRTNTLDAIDKVDIRFERLILILQVIAPFCPPARASVRMSVV